MNDRTKHIVYEQRKAVLRMMNLSPQEYEKAIKQIAKELRI